MKNAFRSARLVYVVMFMFVAVLVISGAAQAAGKQDVEINKEIKTIKKNLKSALAALHKLNEEGSEADQEKAQEMINKSGQMGVPVILITPENGEEQMVIGFDKEKIASLLGL